jgi:hypothetical protein
MPLLLTAHPRLEDAEGLDKVTRTTLWSSWWLHDYEPLTYYSFKDIKKRLIGRRLTELPFACRFGADLVFHETYKSKFERSALYGIAEAARTFRSEPEPDRSRAEGGALKGVPRGHLVVKRNGVLVSRDALAAAGGQPRGAQALLQQLRQARGERDGARQACGGDKAVAAGRQRALLSY